MNESDTDLSEFGTEIPAGACVTNKSRVQEAPSCGGGSSCDSGTFVQWAVSGNNEFMAVASTTPKLPAGVYKQQRTDHGIQLEKLDIKVDTLISFPDDLPKIVCDEITSFWKKGAIFYEYGFLHRRGYLLYGPAGCGKTAVVQLIANEVIAGGDVVMMCNHPPTLRDALIVFRKVEPERRVVCVFEDIDATVQEYGDDAVLALLDGENQIDRVLNLATTNYPERLDPRLISRPRRFDRVIKINMPSALTRKTYLTTKLKINGKELTGWVEKTEGLSFAALAELVISVKCLGNDFDKTLATLRKLGEQKVSSTDYRRAIGIQQPTSEPR